MQKAERNNRIVAAWLLFALLFMLTACGSSDKPFLPEQTETAPVTTAEPEVDDGLLHLATEGEICPVIYSTRADGDTVALCQSLCDAIAGRIKAVPQLESDRVPSADKIPEDKTEILVGLTNRTDSSLLRESLKPLTFAIAVTGHKAVIVGSNYQMLTDGVEYFIENFLESGAVISRTDEWALRRGDSYVSPPAIASLENLMEPDGRYNRTLTDLFEVEDTDYPFLCAGCSDGESYYLLFRSTRPDGTGRYTGVLKKYRLTDYSLVLTSKPFVTDSAYDLTYDGSLDRILLVNGEPNPRSVTSIDPETLSAAAELTAGTGIVALAYLGGHGFAAVESTTSELLLLDASLSVKKRTGTTVDENVMSLCADGSFIYLLTSDSLNMVAVYKPDGEHLTDFIISVSKSRARSIDILNTGLIVASRTPSQAAGAVQELTLGYEE